MTKLTRVVNIHKEKCTVYIGRSRHEPMHFGNPIFVSTTKTALGKVEVANLRECLIGFNDWLDGTRFEDVEPQRRSWILKNLETLRGEDIGCTCKPKGCHGDVYRVKLGEMTMDEVLDQLPKPKPAQDLPQMDLF